MIIGTAAFARAKKNYSPWSTSALLCGQKEMTQVAILFFNLHPSATPDPSRTHARCPVLEGEMQYQDSQTRTIGELLERSSTFQLMSFLCTRWSAPPLPTIVMRKDLNC